MPLWCASNCCLTQLCARKSSERRPRRRQKHAQLSGRGLEWADTSSLGKWQELGWAKARMQGKDCQIYKSKARTESEAERRPALQRRSRMGRYQLCSALRANGRTKADEVQNGQNAQLSGQMANRQSEARQVVGKEHAQLSAELQNINKTNHGKNTKIRLNLHLIHF